MNVAEAQTHATSHSRRWLTSHCFGLVLCALLWSRPMWQITMRGSFLCSASDLCWVHCCDPDNMTSHHERWLTLHCFKLVLCTLMAGKRFWNKVVASFRCSSPPKLFITTKGASCTSKQATWFSHCWWKLQLLCFLYSFFPQSALDLMLWMTSETMLSSWCCVNQWMISRTMHLLWHRAVAVPA